MDSKQADAPSEAGTMGSHVADHYNKIPEVGVDKRRESRIYYMRNFNNWVKTMIISKELDIVKEDTINRLKVYRKLAVMDLCCGKGGDMMKWITGPVSHVIFADIAGTSVEQCRERYNNPLSRKATFTAEFIVADCTKVRIREKMEDVTRRLDLVSCQFSLHYSFESLPQAQTMLKNASECLREGGRFIGSIPNAREIIRRCEASADGSVGNEVYHIKSHFKKPYPIFGAKYDFHLEGVVDCPEFLVHFPTFVKLAKKFGLKLLYVMSFPSFFNKHKDEGRHLMVRSQALETYPAPDSVKLAASSEHYKHVDDLPRDDGRWVGTLSAPEWEAICLYQVFAFEKVAVSSRDKDGNPLYDL